MFDALGEPGAPGVEITAVAATVPAFAAGAITYGAFGWERCPTALLSTSLLNSTSVNIIARVQSYTAQTTCLCNSKPHFNYFNS